MLTSLDFLNIGEDWPPESERPRLDKYRDNRLLWQGEHTEVYGDWFRVLREDYNVSHEIVFEFHQRLSTLWADLVFGDPPVFMAGEEDSAEQKAVNAIVEHSGFSAVGYEAAIDGSRYGDGLFKVRLKDGQSLIQAQSPATWFPVVSRDDQREVLQHVLAWTFEEGEDTYLRAEIHYRGFIENRLYKLGNDKIQEQVDLASFFPDRLETEETRARDFLVQHVPGLRASDEFYGKDDYGVVDSLILELEARDAQISRVQDKHSDPSMYGDEDLARVNPRTGETEFEAGGQFYPVREGGTTPGYLTWDASQENQFN